MNKVLSLLVLPIFPLMLTAQVNGNKPIKKTRTTIYQAVAKDSTFTTGAIVAHFNYVRYDELGRVWIERQVNDKGETVRQIQYAYNNDNRVARQIATSQKEPFRDYSYSYDEQGRLVGVLCVDSVGVLITKSDLSFYADGKFEKLIHEYNVLNQKGEPQNDRYIYIDYYMYNGDGELIEVNQERAIKGVPRIIVRKPEKHDKQPVRLLKGLDIAAMKDAMILKNLPNDSIAIQEQTVVFEYDCYDNWVKRTELTDSVPQFISLRTIDYDTLTTQCQQLNLQHRVKTVKQSSYKAIHKGPGSIDKGAKQGVFYVYEFDAAGHKTKEDHYSEVGVKLGATQYVYNDNDQVVKENRKDANGNLKQSVDWNYDAQGQLKNKVIKTAAGEISHKGIFHYNIERNCVAQIWYAKDGTKCAEMAYLYDGFGQLIEEQVLLKPQIDLGVEFKNIKRKWNSRGRVEEELVENDNGEIELLTYKYNKNGKLIGGSEAFNDQPAIDYVYKFYNDEHGNWKKKVKFVNDISTVYEEREYVYYN